MLASRSRSAPVDHPLPAPAFPPRASKTTLAVVATSDELCGVAAYARSLLRHLSEIFDVTLFELDQSLLRSTHPRIRRLADQSIEAICRDIARFDAVNLQLEHGTLGRRTADIYRRFRWLVGAAPKISVTFHTMYSSPEFDNFFKQVLALNLKSAIKSRFAFYRHHRLSIGIPKRLCRAQRHKEVAAIVHNRRDLRDLNRVHRIRNVYDHPLAYLSDTEADEIRSTASARQFPLLDRVPKESVLIGVFGFLNQYKGFTTVIQALHHLPANYHLLIFGGVHPNDITPHQPVHPYVSTLFEAAYVDTTLPEGLAGSAGGPGLSFAVDRSAIDALATHPKDLSSRLHFMGSLRDPGFLAGMAICDTVVFPYLEVGQSSSGPIAQALELGCRIIASRTHAFLEFGRYHKDRIEFFDIGNHLELAALIEARPQFDARRRPPDYNVETNLAVYRLANGGPRQAPPRRAALWPALALRRGAP